MKKITSKKLRSLFKNRRQFSKNKVQLPTAIVVVAGVAFLGYNLLVASHAQSPAFSLNAASGSLANGATLDPSGLYVLFGSVSPGGTYAGPITVGNTCGDVGSCSAQNGNYAANTDGGVPETVSVLGVSSDGVLMSAAAWEENSHNINVYAQGTGYPEGLDTGDSGPPANSYNGLPYNSYGTLGLAMDSTYMYGAESTGQITRFSRATWTNPNNISASDPTGGATGAGPLLVDSGGNPLLGETLCDGNLYVTDSSGSMPSSGLSPSTTEIKEVPTSLSGVTASWSAPNTSTLTCDREGDIWAMVENAVGSQDELERYSPSGSLLASFSLPSSIIAQGIAASPSSDQILVADNGVDQDFKWFNYSGSQVGQVGVTGGYLEGSDPGLIGPGRAAAPRAVAIGGSGNIYTAENCLPNDAQTETKLNGPCSIITEYQSNGSTVVWRDVSANTFGGTGSPTNDGTKFFDRDFEFIRDSSGKYQPYAFTADPWEYPNDVRVETTPNQGPVNQSYGAGTYEWEGDGHRYIGEDSGNGVFYEYEQMPNSEIMAPVWQVPSEGGYENVFVDDSTGNIWVVNLGGAGGNNVGEYSLTGFTSSGAPTYSSEINYGMPPGLVDVRGVDVEGSTIYITGFSSSDYDNNNTIPGNFQAVGPTLIKFNALPTTSGWPSAAWTTDPTYSVNASDTQPFANAYSFAVDTQANTIGITLFYVPTNNGYLVNEGALDEYSTTNGAFIQTLAPPLPGNGVGEGAFDSQDQITSKNGWFFMADDWFTRIIGICPSGACT